MEQNRQPQMTAEERQLLVHQATWIKQAHNGASWFYWIAGLSLVNTLMSIFDAGFGFFAGLGVTQVVDVIAELLLEQSTELTPAFVWGIALAINLVIVGIFALLGVFARKAKPWAFITGLVLFSMDALLFLYFGDILGFAFHIYVIVMLAIGLTGLNKLRKSIPQQTTVNETGMVVDQL